MSDYTLSFATSLTMLHFSSVAIAARVERSYLYAENLSHKPVCDMFITVNSFQSTLVRICNTHVAKTSILLLISVQSHSFETKPTSTNSFICCEILVTKRLEMRPLLAKNYQSDSTGLVHCHMPHVLGMQN